MRLGRLPAPTGDARTDALRQLRWAMSGEGLTPDKLPVMTAVLDLPVVRESLAGVPESGRAARAYEVVADAARALGSALPQRILRTALAVDYRGRGRNLTERRLEYAATRDPHTLFYIEQRMLESLVTSLGGVPEEPVADAPRAWHLPTPRDPHFVGRDGVLAAVRAALAAGRPVVLAGPPGVGTSAVATEYAYRYAADYDVVWWLRAAEPVTLAADCAALAAAVGRPADDPAAAVRAVREAPAGRRLLVLDDADPDGPAASLLGAPGSVLVTSAASAWPAPVVAVPPLDAADAAALLLRRTGESDAAAAARLAAAVGGLPLLVEVAAAMSVRGAGRSLAALAALAGSLDADALLAAAVDRALVVPGVREVLAAACVQHPDAVDEALLVEVSGLSEEVAARALGGLRAHRLLRSRADGSALHRLLGAAARERLDPAAWRAAAARLADRLDRAPTHAPYVAAALADDERAARVRDWYADRLRRDGLDG